MELEFSWGFTLPTEVVLLMDRIIFVMKLIDYEQKHVEKIYITQMQYVIFLQSCSSIILMYFCFIFKTIHKCFSVDFSINL